MFATDAIQGVHGTTVRPSGASGYLILQKRWGMDCTALLWIDGNPATGDDLRNLPSRSIEGIEIYRGYELPPRFQRVDHQKGWSECGGTVIWTGPPS